jgi:carboxylate-amine ligase
MASSLLDLRPDTSPSSDDTFRFGIEEEYFLADATTMAVASRTPEALFNKLAENGGVIKREMLQAQLEIATRPHTDTSSARRELQELRETAAQAAAEHGLMILACGTHPTALWRGIQQSPKARYDDVMECLQMLGQRNMVCGMHVHVEVPEPERRIDIMARMTPYLPLLIALSTSSPFWQSQCTGLKSYRLAAYDELPRTGIPELFRCSEDYESYLSALTSSGAIEDATHVWWSIRPSQTYPTLELRATDSCTRVDDALAIAVLYRCMVRSLYRNPAMNAELGAVDRAIAVENKWRAQRYGVEGTFVTKHGAVSIPDMLEQVIEDIEADVEALDCLDEIYHCRSIAADGTSADAQLRLFRQHRARGSDAALQVVTRWIADATLAA